MTSCTDKTEKRRSAKKFSGGQARKNKVRKEGTTPLLFSLNKPVAGEGVKKVDPAKAAAAVAKKPVAAKKTAAPKKPAVAKKTVAEKKPAAEKKTTKK
jgi:histone H1/5